MSPVIRNRADGMQIVMGYKDANNNEQKYIYGSKDPTPDNKFVQQVVGTLDKLVELGADQNGIINTLKDDDSYSQISEIGTQPTPPRPPSPPQPVAPLPPAYRSRRFPPAGCR